MELLTFAIVEDQNRFLMIKEASPKWKNKWFFPGGKVEKGENIQMCAGRETLEEAGLKINTSGIVYMECKEGRLLNKTKLYLYVSAKSMGGTLKYFADNHSLGAEWFTFEEIKKLELRDNILEIINRYREVRIPFPIDHLKFN